MKLFISSVLIVLLFSEMKSGNIVGDNYAFQLTSIVSDIKDIGSDTQYDTTISPFYYYKGKLIELVLKNITETTVTVSSVTVQKRFDTIGIQLIDPATQRFVWIDSFYSGAKMTACGKYAESKMGVKVGDFQVDESGVEDSKSLPVFRDTLMDGQELKYDVDYCKDQRGNDSTVFIMYFHKSNKLFTPFMIGGLRFTKSDIALSGFEYIVFGAGKKIKKMTEHIRPMSDYESDVCEMIYKASLPFLAPKAD